MKEYSRLSRQLLEFIEQSPSCFHVINNIKFRLEQEGFCPLQEQEDWILEAGGAYYVTRNDSSIIAFRIPRMEGDKEEWKGFHIVASHSDSPTFKIKENPEMLQENAYVKINTEKYGGMIMSSWLDRPMSVAGRVVIQREEELISRLVNLDQDLMVIPSVAIHMNREANKSVEYNPQVDMIPLFAGTEGKGLKSSLKAKVAKAAGVKEKEILGQDLFLYVRERGRVFGANKEFILSPKLDDLQCVYASLEAICSTTPQQYISVLAVFDNEEVGSGTRQGADSSFLQDVLERICDYTGTRMKEYRKRLADSFVISADNAHAVHPNHPEKADPTNRPYLNGGPVIKFHGGQKYTTDAVSAAFIKHLCKQAQIPYQTYANRSDVAGGSTLGNISTAHVSVPSADIGLPQLAMHSAVETGGVRDLEYGITLLECFYRL